MELFSFFSQSPFVSGGILLFGLACLAYSFHELEKKRLIEDIPTSKVMNVFIGLVEVKGEVIPLETVTSYLTETESVYYRYEIKERWEKTETTTNEEGETETETESGWKTVDSGEVRRSFELEDDTGSLRVCPEGANIQGEEVMNRRCHRSDPLYYEKGPGHSIPHSTGERRFEEYVVEPGEDLYVIGRAELREEVVEPEIRDTEDSRMFLISTKSEKEVLSGKRWAVAISLILGILGFFGSPAAGYAVAATEKWRAVQTHMPAILSWGGLGVFLSFVSYAVSTFNGLVDVQNRLEKVERLIDIELKRRHDLIPRLVDCVKGMIEHEAELQETIAEARRPDIDDKEAASEAVDKQTEVASQVVATVEDYPELKSNDTVQSLIEQLVETEEKISLARNYYNDSVQNYNDRVQTFPTILYASLFGFGTKQHLEIEEFERKPVDIDEEIDSKEIENEPSGSGGNPDEEVVG